MSCDDFIAAIIAGTRPVAQLEAHAESCSSCAQLWKVEIALRAARPSVSAQVAGPELQRLFEVPHAGSTRHASRAADAPRTRRGRGLHRLRTGGDCRARICAWLRSGSWCFRSWRWRWR